MTVKVGIIGMGFMGRMHLSAYRKLPGVEVVAFADTDAEKRAGTATGAGNLGDTAFEADVDSFQKIYDSGLGLIEDPDIQLVDICVPTPHHKDLFLAAVAVGKHVLSEKPMAVHPDDVRAMVAAGLQAKTAVMIGHCIRFWPAYVLLKECVDTRKYGACRSLILRRQGAKGLWSPWYFQADASGGALYDLHVHDTDFVNCLFGRPLAVSSVGSRGGTTDHGVDHVVTNYYFPPGTVDAVTAIGAWHQHKTWPFYMGYTAVFERATLDFDINRPQPVMLYTDDAATELTVDATDGWFEEIKYLVQCVADGVPPERNTIASAAVTMAIVQAEQRSITSGKVENVE